MEEPASRRERKKQRTRETIRDAALLLFEAQGYEATTIKMIADAADVAPRTVTLHFATKEDLLFSEDDPFSADRLEQRLGQRANGETALEALRAWMLATVDEVELLDSTRGRRHWHVRALRARLIANDDHLRGRARASYAAAEHVLAAAIAADLSISATSLAPSLAARSAVAGLRELYESDEVRALGDEPSAADLAPLISRVISFAGAGLAAASVAT